MSLYTSISRFKRSAIFDSFGETVPERNSRTTCRPPQHLSSPQPIRIASRRSKCEGDDLIRINKSGCELKTSDEGWHFSDRGTRIGKSGRLIGFTGTVSLAKIFRTSSGKSRCKGKLRSSEPVDISGSTLMCGWLIMRGRTVEEESGGGGSLSSILSIKPGAELVPFGVRRRNK